MTNIKIGAKLPDNFQNLQAVLFRILYFLEQ